MISLRGVSKSYTPLIGRRVLAVDDVTLEVAPGEVVGIAGPNGVKTWRAEHALRRLATLVGLGADAVGPAVERVIALLEIGEHRKKRIKALSKGNFQRLGLAQALLREHDVVVFDEPTHGLDPVWTQRFRSVVVSGTNAKGSICSMIYAILRAARLPVGLYTSPHLEDLLGQRGVGQRHRLICCEPHRHFEVLVGVAYVPPGLQASPEDAIQIGRGGRGRSLFHDVAEDRRVNPLALQPDRHLRGGRCGTDPDGGAARDPVRLSRQPDMDRQARPHVL